MAEAYVIGLLVTALLQVSQHGESAALDGLSEADAEKVWVYLTSDMDGDRYAMRLSDMRLKPDLYGHKSAWIEVDHSRNAKTKARISKNRYSFDCKRRTYAITSMTVLLPDGTVAYSWNGIGASEHVVPDSIGEIWWKAACNR